MPKFQSVAAGLIFLTVALVTAQTGQTTIALSPLLGVPDGRWIDVLPGDSPANERARSNGVGYAANWYLT
jgi:hypothetical protein